MCVYHLSSSLAIRIDQLWLDQFDRHLRDAVLILLLNLNLSVLVSVRQFCQHGCALDLKFERGPTSRRKLISFTRQQKLTPLFHGLVELGIVLPSQYADFETTLHIFRHWP